MRNKEERWQKLEFDWLAKKKSVGRFVEQHQPPSSALRLLSPLTPGAWITHGSALPHVRLCILDYLNPERLNVSIDEGQPNVCCHTCVIHYSLNCVQIRYMQEAPLYSSWALNPVAVMNLKYLYSQQIPCWKKMWKIHYHLMISTSSSFPDVICCKKSKAVFTTQLHMTSFLCQGE